jgi:peptidoglycan/LPS O-acetylase OafA/YrhL
MGYPMGGTVRPMQWRLGYRPELDGIRAGAVLAVMLVHADVSGFKAGYLGVDVFFVLSGFLITSLLVEELQRSDGIRFANFWARRALRLLPALFAMVAVVWLFAGVFVSPGTRDGVRPTLLYYTNWWEVAGHHAGVLGHTWSLAIEEQFYLVWPLLLFVLWRIDRTLRLALWVCVAGALAAAAARQWQSGRIPIGEWYSHSGYRADGLLVGCVVAIVVHTRELPRWAHDPHLPGLAATILLSVMVAATRLHGLAGPAEEIASLHFVVALATGLLIVGCLAGNAPGWLSHPVARWIGVRSYAMYLWHFPLMRNRWIIDGDPDIVWGFVLTFAAAALSYRFIEAPCLALRARLRSTGSRDADSSVRLADRQPVGR